MGEEEEKNEEMKGCRVLYQTKENILKLKRREKKETTQEFMGFDLMTRGEMKIIVIFIVADDELFL